MAYIRWYWTFQTKSIPTTVTDFLKDNHVTSDLPNLLIIASDTETSQETDKQEENGEGSKVEEQTNKTPVAPASNEEEAQPSLPTNKKDPNVDKEAGDNGKEGDEELMNENAEEGNKDGSYEMKMNEVKNPVIVR